jgi:hypothetical protein
MCKNSQRGMNKKKRLGSLFWRLFAVNYVREKEGIRSWEHFVALT